MTDFDFNQEFEPSGAMLFMAGGRNTAEQRIFNEIYEGSGVDAWAEERAGRFSERIVPQLIYVSADGNHKVAWLSHTRGTQYASTEGVRKVAWASHLRVAEENTAEDIDFTLGNNLHHVICDCAAETPEIGSPQKVQDCEYVQAVLGQRAGEVSGNYSVDHFLDVPLLSPEGYDSEYAPELNREALLRTVLAAILQIDNTRPDQWMAANRVSGVHDIDVLAALVGQEVDAISPILKDWAGLGIVAVRDGRVNLGANAFLL